MQSEILLLEEKAGFLIDRRWNFYLADNHILHNDLCACTLHYHSFFEVEIPYAGQADHYLNDRQYLAQPGEVTLLRYFDAHRYQCTPGDGIRIYNLIFNSAALPEEILSLLTRNSGNLVCRFDGVEFDSLLSDVRFLLEGQTAEDADPIHIHMMRTVFTKLVLSVLQKCLSGNLARAEVPGTPFHNALQIIQCRFRQNITLNQIAREVGVTPNYLGQLFLNHFQIRFTDYLRKVRLEYAKNLLHFSNYSIEQVAFLSGFATDSHFISCFKKAYGTTPRLYKKEKI